MSFGGSLESHREAPPSYVPDGDPGRHGGGTYTGHSVEPTLEAYENIFGPSARDIKQDLQRFKRHGRWHLPDILKGPNQYLTDRVDGLITDAASSPFTSRILPYKYITNVDGKIKWNVWSFDEGLASRVPYESAARTLTQTKRSYAGYFIRQGMAIVLEHNFMMTEAGRENFRRQLNQLVGSIQLTNDLDVHVALVLAPSYQKTMNERYLTQDKSPEQICREFVELFGFVQKNQNALDILIEEAKGQLKTWGAPMPDFMLCNSKLTFQLTMTPDVTNYVTQGPEGQKRLKNGPALSSYRGIGIVHTRAFSMETGAPPRDMLRRRVRVAEYYRILPHKDNHKRLFQLYNEGRDTWATFTFADLLHKSLCDNQDSARRRGPGQDNNQTIARFVQHLSSGAQGKPGGVKAMHLGEPVHLESTQQDKKQQVSNFMKQYLRNQGARSFSWTPMFMDNTGDLVFVPGAIDARNYDTLFAETLENIAKQLPPYIADPLLQFMEEKRTSVGDDQFKLQCLVAVNSIAFYRRNFTLEKWMDLENPVLVDSWKTYDVFHNFDRIDVKSPTPHEQRKIECCLRASARNYMRFGVPTVWLKKPQFKNATDKAKALDLQILSKEELSDQTLRDLGAWFSPNHFKEPNKSFSTLGDWLAYHMLMPTEFIKTCHLIRDKGRLNLDHAPVHMHTLLHDVIEDFESHGELLDEIVKLLQTVQNEMNRAGAPAKYTRCSLTEIFGKALLNIIETYATKIKYDDKHISVLKGDVVFWLLPRTTSCDQDVFADTADRTEWKRQLKRMDIFRDHLNITTDVVDAINAKNDFDKVSIDSINYAVDGPGALQPVKILDAKNVLNMLAWRMWADQEIPLGTVYTSVTAKWPPPQSFLFPSHNAGSKGFGYGVMMYGDPSMGGPPGVDPRDVMASEMTQNVEVVIVRPNIEHYMMGIILGQGGESLGSTFWGQTELSCYDDSMHGIWGMSYKYHERAIVINERNLIRLWDIAYDGYIGGKDDSAVIWNDNDPDHPHSRAAFIQATTDVTRPYRGPSMMVMAFDHTESKNSRGLTEIGMQSMYKQDFSANWPSPIVFYDRLDAGATVAAKADFDNLHAVDVQQFRVFNNEMYHNAYVPYRDKMPNFWELHTIRKNAGLAATENEVSSDALAFQGTMRVLSADSGAVIQEVLGSGHHGPDFIGVASLRAGKGYRLNSQPTVHRLV